MTKKEYLEILSEIQKTDSISYLAELKQLLWEQLKPKIDYMMKQQYYSDSATWTVEDGPGYFSDQVYVEMYYHVPRYESSTIELCFTLEEFLDDEFIKKQEDKKREEAMQKFDPAI